MEEKIDTYLLKNKFDYIRSFDINKNGYEITACNYEDFPIEITVIKSIYSKEEKKIQELEEKIRKANDALYNVGSCTRKKVIEILK